MTWPEKFLTQFRHIFADTLRVSWPFFRPFSKASTTSNGGLRAKARDWTQKTKRFAAECYDNGNDLVSENDEKPTQANCRLSFDAAKKRHLRTADFCLLCILPFIEAQAY